MSGAEQTRESWRYPGDKLNRNLLGRAEGLAPLTAHRCELSHPCLDIVVVTSDSSLFCLQTSAFKIASLKHRQKNHNYCKH